ncbi:MAG: serine hydrolase domain-containing protein [Bacteroidales bacterium]|jgi:CubicO group peptidase (beta-lactamase class C family)|nr:serine hydrolase [Bacteroidales bacterium]MDD3100956.1 serine hydrolase [Bacteroidales bacterium]MDD3639783.1 serine hydrolase [Bacteroidales bacterium]MDD3944511.1 serine hydrolase [Bacteroidales bacterium]MDD4481356.1 serine hydrolase [Bacteroidales bacterium]
MYRTWCFILIPAILSMLVSCDNNDKKALRDIDVLFSHIWSPGQPGGAVLVLKNDQILFEKGFGLATIDPPSPVTPATRFCIASVSKQFAAVATLKLAEAGKLSLEDPVSDYFPQFRADFFRRITLAHLMSHTSGIPDVRPRTDSHYVYHSTDVESYAYLDTLSFLNFPPGSSYEYINPTYQLLYTVVEKASGMSFEEYMRDQVFMPAGMSGTMYFEEGRNIPSMAHGYLYDSTANDWKEYDYGEASFFASKADGALYTSLEEFVLWEHALRNNTLLGEDMTRKAHTSHINTDIPETGYGYGWFITELNGAPKIYHTGDNGGFKIYAGRYPRSGLLLLIFSTVSFDREAVVDQVEKIMTEAGWL